MPDFRRLSKREKLDIIESIIREYPEGICTIKLYNQLGLCSRIGDKYLRELLEEERIRYIDYGRTKIWKAIWRDEHED